jgi:hypothetical protein
MANLGKHDWTPAQMWGFLCEHVYGVRFSLPPAKVYTDLLKLVGDKDYFVVSSNVDGNPSPLQLVYFSPLPLPLSFSSSPCSFSSPPSSSLLISHEGLFAQNGFDESKIYTPQGDFKYMQCYTPCSNQVWESKPVIEAALPFVDKSTQEITNDDVIPKCKFCGGAVSMNVRGGDFFLHEPYDEQHER